MYTLNDINIGDEVYFESSKAQNNHDLYWTVVQKLQSEELIVTLNEMGYQDERTVVKISEVKCLIKKS